VGGVAIQLRAGQQIGRHGVEIVASGGKKKNVRAVGGRPKSIVHWDVSGGNPVRRGAGAPDA